MTPPKRPHSDSGLRSLHDDVLDREVPDVDEPPTPAELARAAAFASLVAKAEHGRIPPALATDDRALLEAATVIRAASGHVELADEARRALVEEVLASSLQARREAHGAGVRRVSVAMRAHGGELERGPARRWVAWTAVASTAAALAAVLALWLRPPRTIVVQARAPVPKAWLSRPADDVIGEIPRSASGEAAARIDSIYSDRLEGYRAATLFRQGDVR